MGWLYKDVYKRQVMENVILRSDRTADFDDASRTENTRVAYPVDYISNADLTGQEMCIRDRSGLRLKFMAENRIQVIQKTGSVP